MYIFALYLLIHKLMKQTILKYLMIGVLVISSISCMDKERDLSWERRHMPKEAYFDFNMIQAVEMCIRDSSRRDIQSPYYI